jgi:hypothetical protein
VGLGARRVERRVGRLELAQDVVEQVDRVGEVLEAEAVLGEPGVGGLMRRVTTTWRGSSVPEAASGSIGV